MVWKVPPYSLLKDAFARAADERVMTAAMRDEFGDGADFEMMLLREGDEIRKARHRSIFFHDLANDGGGIKPRKPAQYL